MKESSSLAVTEDQLLNGDCFINTESSKLTLKAGLLAIELMLKPLKGLFSDTVRIALEKINKNF